MEFWEWLKDYNIVAILFTMVVTILNTFLIQLKTRKSKVEREYLAVAREVSKDLVPADYLAVVDGKYYSMNDVSFVLKSDVSLDDYLKANRKEVTPDEKKDVA